MSVKVQSMVWDADIDPGQKFVLLALADQANDFGKECWPSIMRLADKCNLSERAVQTNLKRLEEGGLISRQARYGRSTYFTIFLEKLVELQKPSRDGYCVISPKIGAKVIHTPAESAPRRKFTPQNLHPEESSPPTANPDSVETPAESAPLQNLHNLEESAPSPRRICTHNHPFNHPLSSSTIDEKLSTVHFQTATFQNELSESEQNPSGLDDGAVAKIFQLLVNLEVGVGRTLVTASSDAVRIQGWINRGAAEPLIRAAHEKACAQRQKQGDPSPVSIGYLDSIILSMLSKHKHQALMVHAQAGTSLTAAPWYVTDAGIESEAIRLGIEPHPGEPFPQFKRRVLAYKQVSYEQYESDCKAFSPSRN